MRIAIIGGGAAGLMASATIVESSATTDVVLIERNIDLGKKVKISGGGRCNVTTGVQDIRSVLSRYPRGGKFLTSAMHAFPPSSVMEWFESHGVPLKIEDDSRVFPVSNRGEDIVNVFEKIYRNPRVTVMTDSSVVGILRTADVYTVKIKNRPDILVDAIILTTGGQAYRQTGSTGDGYAFATSLGHTITPLAPSLSALYTLEKWPADVSGTSFAEARISAPACHAVYEGPFLFTHKGISGPAVFALSSQIAFASMTPQTPVELRIDLFPSQTTDAVMKDLCNRVVDASKKSIENILSSIIPKSLSSICIRELGYSATKKRAGEMSKRDLRRIVEWIKGIPLHAISRGGGDEFVTAGGVSLEEVDSRTMESKKCPLLYFAGEILNIDGYTGGFNLQASWATGRLAGQSAVRKLEKK